MCASLVCFVQSFRGEVFAKFSPVREEAGEYCDSGECPEGVVQPGVRGLAEGLAEEAAD